MQLDIRDVNILVSSAVKLPKTMFLLLEKTL
jgi:hypothetical protein